MDLVERYIEAVKFWLPKKLKEDIAAELRDDIASEIEEAERKKGGKLTEDEVAAILKARGTPLSVASRFLPQRSLIGPELYPLYIFVLKIVAAICFIPPLIGTFLFHSDPSLPNAFASPTYSLLVSFAIVTIIFAVIEYKGINPGKLASFNPKNLPSLIARNRIKRGESVGDIIGGLIVIGFFLAGYLSITTYPLPPSIVVSGGHVALQHTLQGYISVSPEWVPYWQIIVVIAAVEIAFAAANLFKPVWTMPRALLRMMLDLGKTAAICWLLSTNLLRGFAMQGVNGEAVGKLYWLSAQAAVIARPAAAVIAVIIIVTAVWRIVQARRTQLRAASAQA
jgi:hypothetical protein